MTATQTLTQTITGFEGIDKLIVNPEKPKFITVISRPCGGKSTFLLSSAQKLDDSNIPVAFYSFEMSKSQVERRLEKIRGGVDEEESITIVDSLYFASEYDSFIEKNFAFIKDSGCKTVYIDGISHLDTKSSGTLMNSIKTVVMLKHLKKLVKELDVSVIISLNVKDLQINKGIGSSEITSSTLHDVKKALQQHVDALIFLNRPAFSNPEKRDNPEIIEAHVFNNPEGFAGEEKLLFDRNLARFEVRESAESDNNDILGEQVSTVFIACLDGSDEALHHAYRSSIRMLADHNIDFGDEGEPGYLDFKWEFIDRFRVLTVKTSGAGIMRDFSNIPGITDCLWVCYDDNSGMYTSNDTKGEILNRKKLFGIPEADYEVEGDSISEVSGTITFDIDNPESLQVDFSEE